MIQSANMNASGTFNSSSSEAEIDNLRNWYVGANYKFK